MMKFKKAIITGLIALALIIRIIPLMNNRDILSAETFYSNILAIIIGVFVLILIYYIALRTSGSEEAALFSLALATVIPFYSWEISNALSSVIGILFFFSIIYIIPKMKKKKYYLLTIALPLLYSLFNPCGWIIIPLLIIYYILIRVEHLKKDKIENYFLSISVTSLILLTIAFSYSGSVAYTFRTRFLEFLHLSVSLSAINRFNLEDLFYLIGPLPVLFGMVGIYLGMRKNKRMPLLLFSAIASSFLVTLIMGNIFAYVIFSLSMACLASFSYVKIKEKLNQSKAKHFTNIILIILTGIILLSGISRWLI